MNRHTRVLTLVLLVVMGTAVSGSDTLWPQFRGPGSRGVSDAAGLPSSWSTTENVTWVTDIPGLGWSSPIVWDDTVYLTSVVSAEPVEEPLGGLYRGRETWRPSQSEHRWLVYAIDVETGAVKWEREVHRGVPESAHHLKNTLATETAVTDGEVPTDGVSSTGGVRVWPAHGHRVQQVVREQRAGADSAEIGDPVKRARPALAIPNPSVG